MKTGWFLFLIVVLNSFFCADLSAEWRNKSVVGKILPEAPASPSSKEEPSGYLDKDVRVVPVEMWENDIQPYPIVVNRGESVRLVITSADAERTFIIKDLGISIKVPAAQSYGFEFKPRKSGDFIISCDLNCDYGMRDKGGWLKVQ